MAAQIAKGIDGGSALAASAMTRMGGRLAETWKPPAGGGYAGGGPHGGSGGGNTTVNVTVTVNVAGTVLSEHDLADHIQGVLLARGSNNWQAGLVVPGKAH